MAMQNDDTVNSGFTQCISKQPKHGKHRTSAEQTGLNSNERKMCNALTKLFYEFNFKPQISMSGAEYTEFPKEDLYIFYAPLDKRTIDKFIRYCIQQGILEKDGYFPKNLIYHKEKAQSVIEELMAKRYAFEANRKEKLQCSA
jgi:hypothetical protein